MNRSDIIQLAALGMLLLAEQYMVAPWQFPILARVWDGLANLFAKLALVFGFAAMKARANYYSVVNYGG